MPAPASDDCPCWPSCFDLGKVGGTPVSRHLMLAYDDDYSIKYFRRKLRPYWRRNGAGGRRPAPAGGRADYADLHSALPGVRRGADGRPDARRAARSTPGWPRWPTASASPPTSWRPTPTAQPLLFSKENFSNGCIATVDVIYPIGPVLPAVQPDPGQGLAGPGPGLRRVGALEVPVRPARPGHLSRWPTARSTAAARRPRRTRCRSRRAATCCCCWRRWPRSRATPTSPAATGRSCRQWADYLEEKGFDPENQLCTDDFAGHLAHNVNLSAKAILALGAYGLLCEMRGDEGRRRATYRKLAAELAEQWVKAADDGDHFRLAFDRPGHLEPEVQPGLGPLLGLNLFPPESSRKEIAFYRKTHEPLRPAARQPQALRQARLDASGPPRWPTPRTTSRRSSTRSSTSSTSRPAAVPMTDWYWTNDAKQAGFQARSVVGGVFIKLLADPATWKKWSQRGGR